MPRVSRILRGRTRPVPLPRPLHAPEPDPPYDDERDPGDRPVIDGALALAFDPPRSPPESRPGSADERGRPPSDLRRFAQAVAEVLAGRRPPETIIGRFARPARGKLLRAVRSIDPTRIPMVGRPRVCRPRPDVIETCVVINSGPRAYGLALRLERQGVQWLCTDLAAPVLSPASYFGGRRGSA